MYSNNIFARGIVVNVSSSIEDILWIDKGMLKGEVSRLNVEQLIFVLSFKFSNI